IYLDLYQRLIQILFIQIKSILRAHGNALTNLYILTCIFLILLSLANQVINLLALTILASGGNSSGKIHMEIFMTGYNLSAPKTNKGISPRLNAMTFFEN